MHCFTLVGSCVTTTPFLDAESWQLNRRNLCLERFSNRDIRRADSTCMLVNTLSSPARSFSRLFTASVVRTATHTPKWHAVLTSTDIICSVCKTGKIANHETIQVLLVTCTNPVCRDMLKRFSEAVKKSSTICFAFSSCVEFSRGSLRVAPILEEVNGAIFSTKNSQFSNQSFIRTSNDL